MRKPLHRLLIATHHDNCRNAIVKVVQHHLEDTELYHADNLQQCQQILADTTPEMLILDLSIPGSDGLSTLGRLSHSIPQTAIVVLGDQTEAEEVAKYMTEGAAGFILSSLEQEALADAIEQVLDGQVYLPSN